MRASPMRRVSPARVLPVAISFGAEQQRHRIAPIGAMAYELRERPNVPPRAIRSRELGGARIDRSDLRKN